MSQFFILPAVLHTLLSSVHQSNLKENTLLNLLMRYFAPYTIKGNESNKDTCFQILASLPMEFQSEYDPPAHNLNSLFSVRYRVVIRMRNWKHKLRSNEICPEGNTCLTILIEEEWINSTSFKWSYSFLIDILQQMYHGWVLTKLSLCQSGYGEQMFCILHY